MKINFSKKITFILLHFTCFFSLFFEINKNLIIICCLSYFIRMFAITGFFHRYFSHKSFKTNRFFQFIFAILGATAAQRSALWWAAHHREHHKFSDKTEDPHSPLHKGLWWSHMFWFLVQENFETKYKNIPDLKKYPELVFLDKYDELIPFLCVLLSFFCGWYLETRHPYLGINPITFFIWGFIIPTVLAMHVTFSINSLAHRFGYKAYPTKDNSKNNWLLALFTLGEGWHNNHHYYPASVQQGFYWWQIDITFYILKFLSFLGIIHSLRLPAEYIYHEKKSNA
ncbi:MAG: acyl-CoA desaturase [Gammaproteobacteria bacterium]